MEREKKQALLATVSALLLLDSMTLTMVVPIIPDFLLKVDSQLNEDSQESRDFAYHNHSSVLLGPQAYLLDVESENGRVGLLLSSKAIVQLVLNPLVGYWVALSGCLFPLFTGTLVLLLSTLLFAAGQSYLSLFLARASQGLASSCIGISGMSLIADTHTEEADRSRAMGFALSSAALGVLLGYPFGGFMYDLLGKTVPFLIVSAIVFGSVVIQYYTLDWSGIIGSLNEVFGLSALFSKCFKQGPEKGESMWLVLLKDRRILLCGGAIGISTSAMAILEPCLPLWLMGHIKPKKWQLGTAFIPDSLGYALGTNAFNQIAYREGRTQIAVVAMVAVGASCIGIPLATSMLQLVVPHFLLGLGIGAVDAALVPLLASLADSQNASNYGTVYAIQQIAVSLAYALGPIVGGEMVHSMGFAWLMTSVGIVNFIYCPILATLKFFGEPSTLQQDIHCQEIIYIETGKNTAVYKTFDDEVE